MGVFEDFEAEIASLSNAKVAELIEKNEKYKTEIQRLNLEVQRLALALKEIKPKSEREIGLIRSIEQQIASIKRLEVRLDAAETEVFRLNSVIAEKNDYIATRAAVIGRLEAKVDVLREALEVRDRGGRRQ